MAQSPVAVLLALASDGGTTRLSPAASKLRAAGATFELEPLFEATRRPPAGRGAAAGAVRRVSWHIARPSAAPGGTPWDVTHEVANQAAAQGLRPVHAEPDLVQDWGVPRASKAKVGLTGGPFQDQETKGGRAVVNGVFAWHLGDAYSGLAKARADAHAQSDAVIRIAHLDTGYDLDHAVFPRDRFDAALSRNFRDDGRAQDDVRDIIEGGMVENPGHGTGTIGILAGGRFQFDKAGYSFDDFIGGAPDARIVGLRVANSVVQIKTSAVADAIAYATSLCADEDTRVRVLSMSMGGVASQAWADAVNLAYEAGIVLVTAAGNNFSAGFLGGVPTTSTVYPARFQRVLAACGIMANFDPYYGLERGTMQGNWGPTSKRSTSLSAFTPNTPWARRGSPDIVDMNGAGTSSATPQIAAAAALYLRRHAQELFDASRYSKPWMVAEAVRRALVSSAMAPQDSDAFEKLGSGILRADAALEQAPAPPRSLEPAEEADVSFPFFRVLTGRGVTADPSDRMLELELAQLVQQWDDQKAANPFDSLLAKADAQPQGLNTAQQRELLETLAAHPRASSRCRKDIEKSLAALGGRGSGGSGGSSRPEHGKEPGACGPSGQPPIFGSPTPFKPERPKYRELRGYALDPSFATSLSTRTVSETIFRVPWEEGLEAGPADEYIQVMDIDPASDRVYEPVDLDSKYLLASKGLPPSEGTPQFHQQMVYAVARMTISRFESALGRPALWRPGPPRDPAKNPHDDWVYVPRLRIYPHALREANAYYSPDKIALLFGYFGSEPEGEDVPGEQVFTCLSHDIIAHETTHALLDGMHRRYLTDSNPDVLAFHEAFADIVALFQRVMLPELLCFQIALTQGQVRTRRSLLGQLATQFGRAIGHRGALREAIGRIDEKGDWIPSEPSPAEYAATLEPHARGSVLVGAVFDAFVSIYEKRTEDLVRIATDGTGVLPPGAIHPDLVNRLADEASKAAGHVLTMCIRALDYCPPTDLTFGEYLRAIITADYEIVPNDDRGYRVAFVEAFKKRGIMVRGAIHER